MIIDKSSIRSKSLDLLKKRAKIAHDWRSAKVRKHLDLLLRDLNPKSVLIYLPIWFEADIKPSFIKWRKQYKLYAPFMEGVSFKMVRYRLPLQRRELGIFSPDKSGQKIKKVDVMIVPAVAIDSAFRRIGFGKGMYDRFYSTLKNKPIVIFVQPFPVRTKAVVTDSLDIKADFLVSCSGVIQALGNSHDRYAHYRSDYR